MQSSGLCNRFVYDSSQASRVAISVQFDVTWTIFEWSRGEHLPESPNQDGQNWLTTSTGQSINDRSDVGWLDLGS